jgi:peptide/nickel transport system permease protein
MNALSRFAANRGALIGLFLLLVLVAIVVLAPMLYPQSPWRMVGRPMGAPLDGSFILGTDTLGRDRRATRRARRLFRRPHR